MTKDLCSHSGQGSVNGHYFLSKNKERKNEKRKKKEEYNYQVQMVTMSTTVT